MSAELSAIFRCFGNLPKLLKHSARNAPLDYRFKGHPGVKDPIEAMGIPHTEVDVILANGRPVDFKYQLQDLDVIDVYPLFCAVPIKAPQHLSPPPPDAAAFVLDVHLGKLARRLRLLGFDCLYQNDFSDDRILQLALARQRIILTRDRGLLRHRQVVHGYLVRSDRVDEQVNEVLARYLLFERIQPWLRCALCNGLLEAVDKAAIVERLEPKTRQYYADFRRCRACDRLYWQGSHLAKMQHWLGNLLRREP